MALIMDSGADEELVPPHLLLGIIVIILSA